MFGLGAKIEPPQDDSTLLVIAHQDNDRIIERRYKILAGEKLAACLNGNIYGTFEDKIIYIRALDGESFIQIVESSTLASYCTGGRATEEPGKRTVEEVDASAIAGTWEGTYFCSQGETGLRLVVDPGSGSELTANFAFFPIPANPSVPAGNFSMRGFSSSSEVQLSQEQWIERPPGYGMVDLAGSLSPDMSRFTGKVIGRGSTCTTFSLHKVSTTTEVELPSLDVLAGRWVGTYYCSQGKTGLHLTIRTNGRRALSATFEFFPISSNPSTATGSFSMLGSFSASGVRLTQNQWIDKPPGYSMVDLVGNLPTDPADELHGSVVGSSCGSFSLRKE